jgi:hypothetical protein
VSYVGTTNTPGQIPFAHGQGVGGVRKGGMEETERERHIGPRPERDSRLAYVQEPSKHFLLGVCNININKNNKIQIVDTSLRSCWTALLEAMFMETCGELFRP